jgi:hypothetical protein
MTEPVKFPIRAAAPADVRTRVEEVFTPSSPVTRRDLFAGRGLELQQLLDMIRQPGRHAVLFGEPGTGKTSLATIVPEFAAEPLGVVCVTAAAGDTFDTLWRRVADCVRTSLRRAERGLAAGVFPADTPTSLARAEGAGRDEVLALLARLGAIAPAWIVFDNFDLVQDTDTRRRMREIAEATVGAAPGATLVFAGRATSGDLLLEPSSALVPVQVPRLTNDESVEAILRAMRQTGLGVRDVVVERIATLSNGLPHATQALARAAARAAADAGRAEVTSADLDDAVRETIDEATETLRSAYEQATVRARRGIYPEILLACALSPRDAYGTFSVADVCATVTNIVRREVRGLTNQVSALTEEGRGSVLDKRGTAKSARYRFVDPSLEPYILMRGLEEGWATHQTPSWLPESSEAMDLPKAA